MKAILTTRCGCSRTIDISYPPPPQIRIPLRRDWASVWFDENRAPEEVLGIRAFRLQRWLGTPYNPAEYTE